MFYDAYISKVKIKRVPVVGEAVALQTVADAFELTATSLVDRLATHGASLLVPGERLGNNPRRLPDVASPLECGVAFVVRTLLARGRSSNRILNSEVLLKHHPFYQAVGAQTFSK